MCCDMTGGWVEEENGVLMWMTESVRSRVFRSVFLHGCAVVRLCEDFSGEKIIKKQ